MIFGFFGLISEVFAANFRFFWAIISGFFKGFFFVLILEFLGGNFRVFWGNFGADFRFFWVDFGIF